MTRKGITYMFLSIGLIFYLLIGLSMSRTMAKAAPTTKIAVEVASTQMNDFVTPRDVRAELFKAQVLNDTTTASRIDLQAIENYLGALDNIERVNATRRSDNSVVINITPMVPIARVFAPSGSYYINADGKRLTASSRFRASVPVITVWSDTVTGLQRLKPLIDNIDAHPERRELVNGFEVRPNGDIYLVPAIAGHVVNFGDVSAIDDKFDRLFTFYRDIMPVKGWNYYDTISVKFANQVIANVIPDRRRKIDPPTDPDYEEVPFVDDPEEVARNVEYSKSKI